MLTKVAGIKRKRKVLTMKAKRQARTWDKAVVHLNLGTQLWKINKIRHKEKQGFWATSQPWKQLEVPRKGRRSKKATCLWFQQECAKGTPISGPILCEKALQFYRRLHDEDSAEDSDFKASQGWLAWQFLVSPWDSTQIFFYNYSIHKAAKLTSLLKINRKEKVGESNVPVHPWRVGVIILVTRKK